MMLSRLILSESAILTSSARARVCKTALEVHCKFVSSARSYKKIAEERGSLINFEKCVTKAFWQDSNR